MRAIIVGGGKVGFYLAKTLLEHDYSVTIIENDKEQGQFCANNLEAAEINLGNGTSVEALEVCGAAKADAVIAVTGRDESNLVCCQIAKKKFGVKRTIAKVNNPKNTDALKSLGVDIVISATDNIIGLLEREVDLSAVKELIKLNGDEASLIEINLPKNYLLDGKKLSELSLPQGCNIACINRGGKTIIPRGQTTLCSEDSVLIVTLDSAEKELKKALKIKD
jgi:trk system potassium uptake protein TrkA